MSRVLAGIIIAASVAATNTEAPAQNQYWIRQFGTPAFDDVYALCPDQERGVFLAGYTNGSLGGPNAGQTDAWLGRYDSQGDRIWVRQFGENSSDFATAVAADEAGGVFVAGSTDGNLGGSGAGRSDSWLARYDGDGNRLWIRQYGTVGYDGAEAICPDGAGGVFVAGTVDGSRGLPGAPQIDVLLMRYDSAGNRMWIREFGTAAYDDARSLSPDGVGGLFVAGATLGSLGGSGTGGDDIWLARYDNGGNRTWIRQFGTTRDDVANALCPDPAGGVFIAGSTGGSIGWPYSGQQDAWLARYDSAGNQVWTRQLGTSGNDDVAALCADGVGGAFVAGRTDGSLGGPRAGQNDAWIARYDRAGTRIWVRQFGTSMEEVASALCSDGAGSAFIGGFAFSDFGGRNAGSGDVWLARPACPADFSLNGTVDFFDYLDFVAAFAADQPNADFNRNGTVDFFDYLDFIAAFDANC